MIEVVEAFALAIQHAYNFIPHHEGDRQLRARGLSGANITRVLADIGNIYRLLLESRGSHEALAESEESLVLAGIPAALRTDIQLLRLLVEQQDGYVLQMKIVARDRQDSLQHLVQIEGGEHSLAGVV